MLVSGLFIKENCSAEIRGTIELLDSKSNEVLCTYETDVKETIEFSMNNVKLGYKNATQDAVAELIKQIINGLQKC